MGPVPNIIRVRVYRDEFNNGDCWIARSEDLTGLVVQEDTAASAQYAYERCVDTLRQRFGTVDPDSPKALWFSFYREGVPV